MAERKKPETRPQLDGTPCEHDRRRHSSAMTEQQLNNILRFALTAAAPQLTQLKATAAENLKRLRLRRTPAAAYRGAPPEGSDQVDIRSWMDWMGKIKGRDRTAEQQLLTIDATLASRG